MMLMDERWPYEPDSQQLPPLPRPVVGSVTYDLEY